MLETVAIVLNEREANKRKVAEALQTELAIAGITSSRFEITSAIESVIVEEKPSFLIVDYLLGDYSTGLDILTKLKSLPDKNRPKTIFLTDEPSVSVAVEAMILGAVHYIELSNPRAIPAVVEVVTKELRDVPSFPAATVPARTLSLKDLVAHANATRETVEHAERLTHVSPPIVVISGARGTGKATLSKALASGLQIPVLKEIDLEIDDSPLPSFVKDQQPGGTRLRLGKNLGLLLRNVQEDSGEVLEFLTSHHREFFKRETASTRSILIVNTSDEESARAWTRLTGAVHLQLLPLGEERKADFAPLIQHFSNETSRLTGERLKTPGTDFINWAMEEGWPFNLTELRTVLSNALLSQKLPGDDLIENAMRLKQIWEEENLAPTNSAQINPLTAARVLEEAGGKIRIAAARLGCSPMALRSLLYSKAVESMDARQAGIGEGE